MYSIIEPVSVGCDPAQAGEVPPDENPICVVRALFTDASIAPVLLKASAAGEVKTPSKRRTEDTIWSPSRALL